MTTNCIFCEIVAQRSPATAIKVWDDAMAIVPLNPVTEGHVIVIPYRHVTDVLDEPEISAKVMRRAAQLATGPCNFITSVGREATQSVFHLHLHIVPRKKNDGLALPWYSGKGIHNE